MTPEDMEVEIDVLKRNYRSLARRLREAEEYIDTVSSPLYKRIWWTICGYRFRRVGRWYRKTESLR